MMQCLGEMCTYLPLPGALAQYATRYVDPAAGFAIGWNNWYFPLQLIYTRPSMLISFQGTSGVSLKLSKSLLLLNSSATGMTASHPRRGLP